MERPLPPLRLDQTFPLVRAIQIRRSVRSFSSEPLSSEDLGLLLWACQGITDRSEGLRTAPSAGGIFPMEVYAVLAEGLFRYMAQEHSLLSVMERDLRPGLARAALDQQFISAAPLTVAIAADHRLLSRRYGDRARRYMDMEAGHIAQNLHLMAVALDLGSVPVGAFEDSAVERLLDLPSGFEPLYLVPVGKPLPR